MSQKIRVPNFTNAEKSHLLGIVANKYAIIIEDKKTDRVSTAQKIKAWQQIEEEFNAASTSSTYRNAACLKKCYENRKKELRKTLANERKEILLTGGGPSPKIKKNEKSDDILMSILNKKTLIGLNNAYDDDADEIPVDEVDDVYECIFEREEVNEGSLLVRVLKNQGIDSACTSQNWKKYTPNQLQIPINAMLINKESDTNKGIINKETKEPQKSTNRKRPTITVKTMTSDIAKKYNILLDKRLQLIEGQIKNMDAEHALVMRKHQLEVEIVELELVAKQNVSVN